MRYTDDTHMPLGLAASLLERQGFHGNHWAVPAALYAFLRHPESFTEAVLYALSLGGDTDTIASMTGALGGAYLGERAIPAVWCERVEGAAHLRDLADDVCRRLRPPARGVDGGRRQQRPHHSGSF